MHRSLIAIATLAALALSNVSQANEVNRCVAPDGEITLTDSPCPAAAPAAAKPAQAAPGISVDRMSLSGAYTPHDHFVARQPVSRGLARDVATLKLAHQAMLLGDISAASMRQQRVASR